MKRAAAGCAVLLLLTMGAAPSFNTQPAGEKCRCVAFRLDDIQDYYLRDVQIEMMDTFERRDLDLTVGVIGNYFGQDQVMVSYIKERLKGEPRLEIANHGWNHERFVLLDSYGQSRLMGMTNDKLSQIFGFKPLVFIAPYNAINNNTFWAARQNSILYVSANMTVDPPPYSGPDLFRYHETALTGDLSAGGTSWPGYPHTKTMDAIRKSVDRHGFAVVTMHPMEFSVRSGLNFEDRVDRQQMAELELLLNAIDAEGYEVVTVGELSRRALQAGLN
ncbi:MAG: polysaccharide deacetylase family protein [Nitrososphaera sp.]